MRGYDPVWLLAITRRATALFGEIRLLESPIRIKAFTQWENVDGDHVWCLVLKPRKGSRWVLFRRDLIIPRQ